MIPFNIPKEDGLGEIHLEVIVFKDSVDHGEFIKNKSIIFTQNGQVHGFEGQSFISQDLGDISGEGKWRSSVSISIIE